ncbi:MAG: enoyl-CoA hydratase [Acidimicrobiaceae bacterium]|jgi:enoyl-CoA hydratase|nr:enoyl-CoA hydratase [Acidimicrobiaceae bacterium]MDQ1449360.1 enoyl-CoA hydratase [Actinomycetota bacterium]
MPSLRIDSNAGVRTVVFAQAERYNTITPELRDELSDALDDAEADREVRVVLLRAEGSAFCAGFALDWATDSQARVDGAHERVWDSVADLRMIGSYARTWAKLFEISKPTIAAVHGWCIAGGTDMVLNADVILAARSARFGYPPARVWGIPESPWLWVARLGLERAKRYLLTGDEISGEEAAGLGLVLECVPDDELVERAYALAHRMARLPLNQLQMLKLSCNEVARRVYQPETSRLLGCLFDGVARHTQEGLDFVARSQEVGFRQAVRDRDAPFGDYGERTRP